jgi:S-adenosylmethionine-dependent methyltransferase
VRQALVTRALLAHLPAPPQHVLDIGGGNGHQAIALASRGHQVTILDPDEAMLKRAADAWSAAAGTAPVPGGKVELQQGVGEDALELTDGGFDATLCHGVLMYLADPKPLLQAQVACTRPGGLVSVLGKNAEALAMRPALEGRVDDALQLLDADVETGRLGVTSRGHQPAEIQSILAEAGVDHRAWYGVRTFTDHLGDTAVGEDLARWCELEWRAGTHLSYRSVARLFHLLGHRWVRP